MANLGPNAINPAVYSKLPYDSVKDFAPVILATTVPLIIVTAANSPIKDLKQLIAMAKDKPGEITFGSAATGRATTSPANCSIPWRASRWRMSLTRATAPR